MAPEPGPGPYCWGGGAAVEVETPSLLLSTRKGLPHFVSPDMLTSLPSPVSRRLHLSPLHFLGAVSSKTISKLGGLHQILGIQDYGFVALPRDSIQCLPSYDGTNKLGASFETPCGRFLMETYLELLWEGLICLSGKDVQKKLPKEACQATGLVDLDLGSALMSPHLLKVVCECLPAEKPRLICGLGLPEEILQGVAAGVDLFDSTYIYHITIGGFALTFPLRTNRSEIISPLNLAEMGRDSTKISLWSTAYRKDTTPIVEGCECYTCHNQTKAYINHLLNVHEMLAQTLLEIYNTYHFLGFFPDDKGSN